MSDLFKPKFVLLHHSATVDGRVFNWPTIRKYHKSYARNGEIILAGEGESLVSRKVEGVKEPWSDIGYHFGIEPTPFGYEILMGRMPGTKGSHCKQLGMNLQSVGICFTGNYDETEPKQQGWKLGLKLVRWLQTTYKIKTENVIGHRDISDKTCPGNYFDLEKFRSEL